MSQNRAKSMKNDIFLKCQNWENRQNYHFSKLLRQNWHFPKWLRQNYHFSITLAETWRHGASLWSRGTRNQETIENLLFQCKEEGASDRTTLWTFLSIKGHLKSLEWGLKLFQFIQNPKGGVENTIRRRSCSQDFNFWNFLLLSSFVFFHFLSWFYDFFAMLG